MAIDFDDKEILFIYGRIKQELSVLMETKGIRIPKTEQKFYENILSKLEKANPALTKLPL